MSMQSWIKTALVCAVLGACAPIERQQQLTEATGKVLTVPFGGTIATINKQKSLPNAFGKADLYGRQVDTGSIKLIYKGRAPDGGALVEQIDVDVHSNASVFTRMPSTYSSSASASIAGTPTALHGNANSTAFAMAPQSETNMVLPPNVVAFPVPRGKTLTVSTGDTIEFLDIQPHQVTYKIATAKP